MLVGRVGNLLCDGECFWVICKGMIGIKWGFGKILV